MTTPTSIVPTCSRLGSGPPRRCREQPPAGPRLAGRRARSTPGRTAAAEATAATGRERSEQLAAPGLALVRRRRARFSAPPRRPGGSAPRPLRARARCRSGPPWLWSAPARPPPTAARWPSTSAGSWRAAGVTVVSGMARGVDAAAHRGALAGRRADRRPCGAPAPTVSTRRSTQQLAAEIAEHGALVTEYPPGSPPLAHHFPERNRLIAGLAQASSWSRRTSARAP